MKVLVQQGQSLLDIALQTTGSAEAAFDLALKNGLSITDDLSAGDELLTTDLFNKHIKSYYDNRNIKPATALTEELSGIFDYTFDYTFE